MEVDFKDTPMKAEWLSCLGSCHVSGVGFINNNNNNKTTCQLIVLAH